MEKLNAAQLGMILKIAPDAARRKMIAAYCRENGETPNVGSLNNKKVSFNPFDYPKKMGIDMLAKNLNIPHLRMAVDDIRNNYLKRSATRGYIINYPLSKIQERLSEANISPITIKIPITLRTILKPEDRDEILKLWRDKYKGYIWVSFA